VDEDGGGVELDVGVKLRVVVDVPLTHADSEGSLKKNRKKFTHCRMELAKPGNQDVETEFSSFFLCVLKQKLILFI
jgi:hypothetical protein